MLKGGLPRLLEGDARPDSQTNVLAADGRSAMSSTNQSKREGVLQAADVCYARILAPSITIVSAK